MAPDVERLVIDVKEALQALPGCYVRLSISCFNVWFTKTERYFVHVVQHIFPTFAFFTLNFEVSDVVVSMACSYVKSGAA